MEDIKQVKVSKLEDGKFTTKDGLFTLEVVSCLGACGLAPVLTVNDDVYGKITADDVDDDCAFVFGNQILS